MICFIGVYLLSALIMWLITTQRSKKENKVLDIDDKTLIFTPVINTIALIAEIWDAIYH